MRAPRFALAAVTVLVGVAFAADPYRSPLDRSYDSFNAQLSRAFTAPPPPPSAPSYRSSISSGGSSSSSSSSSGSGSSSRILSEANAGYSSNRPSVPRDWAAEKSSALDTQIAKARRSAARPDAATATEAQLSAYYMQAGLSFKVASEEARWDLRQHQANVDKAKRSKEWANYYAEQARLQAYADARRNAHTSYYAALGAARARALGGDAAAIQEWFDLARTTFWQDKFIDGNPAARREAIVFASDRGLPEAMRARLGISQPGEESRTWRDRCAELGDLPVMEWMMKDYVEGPERNFSAAAAILEKVYVAAPQQKALGQNMDVKKVQAVAAFYLARIYAQGDARLPADPAKAVAWTRKLPLARVFETWGWACRGLALQEFSRHPTTVRAVEAELVALWEESARDGDKVDALRALAEIFGGLNPAYVASVNRARADAITDQMAELSRRAETPDVWVSRYFSRSGQWDKAAEINAQIERVPGLRPEYLLEIGLFWRDRPDGKADLGRASALLERAAQNVKDAPSAPRALADAYFAAGQGPKAVATLQGVIAQGGLHEKVRAQLRLAVASFRGEGMEPSFFGAKKLIGEARHAVEYRLLEKSRWAEGEEAVLREFARELDFQEIAAPTLAEFARIEGIQGSSDKAERHRVNFARAEPKLRALALDGYREAQRVWAQIALSSYVTIEGQALEFALELVRAAAERDEPNAAPILGRWLLRDALRREKNGEPDSPAWQAQLTEAVDWLEVAATAGERSVRPTLAECYRDGVGRPKSPARAREIFARLSAEGDDYAREEFAALSEPGFNAQSLTPAQARVAEAARIEARRRAADAGDPQAQREHGLALYRGGVTEQNGLGGFDYVALAAKNCADFEAMVWCYRVIYLEAGASAEEVADARTLFLENAAAGKPADTHRAGLVLLNDPQREPSCFLAEPDLDGAQALFTKAKEGGVAEAAVRLADVAALRASVGRGSAAGLTTAQLKAQKIAKFRKLQHAADAGDGVAMRELGLAYLRDEDEAGRRLLHVAGAAHADFEAAAWLFRLTYLDPKTDQEGRAGARQLFDEMVAAGKPADHYRAGLVLMNHAKLEPLCFLKEPDLPAARALFLRAKEGGVPEAAARLAEVEALLKK